MGGGEWPQMGKRWIRGRKGALWENGPTEQHGVFTNNMEP